jgi:hypothetical protein
MTNDNFFTHAWFIKIERKNLKNMWVYSKSFQIIISEYDNGVPPLFFGGFSSFFFLPYRSSVQGWVHPHGWGHPWVGANQRARGWREGRQLRGLRGALQRRSKVQVMPRMEFARVCVFLQLMVY